jgi:hypothetical protein
MRQSRILASAVSAALMLTMVFALSAQAARPSPYYIVYRADCGYDFSGAHQWVSGDVLHIRGLVAYHVNYFLDDVHGTWVRSGTNVTTASVNSSQAGTSSHAWGKFEVRDTLVGDFDGSWTWGNNGTGNAVGQGVGGSMGTHLHTELLGEAPAGLPAPPTTGCEGGGYEFWSVH